MGPSGVESASSRVHEDLEMVLWDGAWPGAKGQDEGGGLPALNCVMRKVVSQGFGFFFVMTGSLSRHLTFYGS